MKKLLFTALIAIAFTTSSFASGETKVSNRIKSSFEYDFSDVKDVQWSKTASFTTATFVLNNKRTSAFYEGSGELVGTSHAITIESLPAFAKRAFAKKYADYTVTEAIQFDSKDETAYYISAKKDNKSIVLKVADGYMSIFN